MTSKRPEKPSASPGRHRRSRPQITGNLCGLIPLHMCRYVRLNGGGFIPAELGDLVRSVAIATRWRYRWTSRTIWCAFSRLALAGLGPIETGEQLPAAVETVRVPVQRGESQIGGRIEQRAFDEGGEVLAGQDPAGERQKEAIEHTG